MKSILVIGGGLVGAACALRLQAAGVATTLIDPGDRRRGASFGNAGHIGAEQVMPWSTWGNLIGAPLHLFGAGGPLDFRWRDIALWLPWSLRFMAASAPNRVAASNAALTALLRDAMGAWLRLETLADMPGMVCPHGQANIYMSTRTGDKARELWARTPIGACRYREMSSDELARYDGVLHARPASGLHFDGTGQVRDPQGARDGILTKFSALGGLTICDAVTTLDADASVRTQSGRQFAADALLVACGAWSAPLMRQLGAAAPLIGERGYSMQSTEHNWPSDLPTTIFEERSVVLSRFTSGLRATSFLEFGSPGAPADPRKWARLHKHLDDLGVRFSRAPDRWVGPRPTLPDYVPAIGRLKRSPNAFYAFGHAHLGLTECAITAEIIEALATDKPPPLDLAPFAIERFG
ncbi:MAG: FAD-binding oxidoreductase [Proteobacteria bacterium]|nr:FAD-binding oxidoreductase [Pseudomonadota bacterium]